MKIPTEEIQRANTIVSKVPDGKTEGLQYETLKDWTGVDQLDTFDERHALVLRRSEGAVTLESLALP
jgi:hypothetical protein